MCDLDMEKGKLPCGSREGSSVGERMFSSLSKDGLAGCVSRSDLGQLRIVVSSILFQNTLLTSNVAFALKGVLYFDLPACVIHENMLNVQHQLLCLSKIHTCHYLETIYQQI